MFGISSAAIIAILLYIICLLLVSIIANYKLFQKAGEEGWKSLIPIYSQVVFCKCFLGKAEYAAIPIASRFFLRFWAKGTYFASFLTIPLAIVSIIFNIYRNISLGKSFGKSNSFIFGLVFLPFIFQLMLAFGDDQYYGPRGVSSYSDVYNNGYGNTSYIGTNGYMNNGYNLNNAYQNNGYANSNTYQNGGYNNNTGYQNTGYSNGNTYQNGGYDNNSGYQNTSYSNSNAYQNGGYDNNTGYQNTGYSNSNAYQNGGYDNNSGYQNTGYTKNNAYQNVNQLYSNSYYQNNDSIMDDIDTSGINIDNL